jgi:hypothetical protein
VRFRVRFLKSLRRESVTTTSAVTVNMWKQVVSFARVPRRAGLIGCNLPCNSVLAVGIALGFTNFETGCHERRLLA